jgi:hypothetical protein
MSAHYGPTWAWNQNRPEAIEVRAQMAECHIEGGILVRRKLDTQEHRGIWLRQLTKHFPLIEKMLRFL